MERGDEKRFGVQLNLKEGTEKCFRDHIVNEKRR
jgi:hypothetical protein